MLIGVLVTAKGINSAVGLLRTRSHVHVSVLRVLMAVLSISNQMMISDYFRLSQGSLKPTKRSSDNALELSESIKGYLNDYDVEKGSMRSTKHRSFRAVLAAVNVYLNLWVKYLSIKLMDLINEACVASV